MTGDGIRTLDPARGAGSSAAPASVAATLLDAPARAGGELEDRILDAALLLEARWGMSKTTLADVAREAGCSRATLYRAFPGGKQELFLAVGRRELTAYFQRIVDRVAAARDLEDGLTVTILEASRQFTDHGALQYVLEHEPDIVLPFLGFHQVDRLYRALTQAVGPAFERFLPTDPGWAVEWAARVVLSFVFNPSADVSLSSDHDVRHLVRTFLLPALQPQPALTVHP